MCFTSQDSMTKGWRRANFYKVFDSWNPITPKQIISDSKRVSMTLSSGEFRSSLYLNIFQFPTFLCYTFKKVVDMNLSKSFFLKHVELQTLYLFLFYLLDYPKLFVNFVLFWVPFSFQIYYRFCCNLWRDRNNCSSLKDETFRNLKTRAICWMSPKRLKLLLNKM